MISRRIVETINYLYRPQHEHNSFSKLFKDLEFRSHSHSFRPHVKRRTVIHNDYSKFLATTDTEMPGAKSINKHGTTIPKNGVCRHATERDTKSARNDLINFIEGSCDYGNARLPTVKHALHEDTPTRRTIRYSRKNTVCWKKKKKKMNLTSIYSLVSTTKATIEGLLVAYFCSIDTFSTGIKEMARNSSRSDDPWTRSPFI